RRRHPFRVDGDGRAPAGGPRAQHAPGAAQQGVGGGARRLLRLPAGRVRGRRAVDAGRDRPPGNPQRRRRPGQGQGAPGRAVDRRESLNGDDGPDKSKTLLDELGAVKAELAEAEAFMQANGFSPTIGKRVTELEAREDDLAKQLAEARKKAAHPLSETWGEATTPLAPLDAAPDQTEARLRLRSALRRMTDSLWLLIISRGRTRLCAVQVWFAGEKRHRDYLVMYRSAIDNGVARREGGYRVR